VILKKPYFIRMFEGKIQEIFKRNLDTTGGLGALSKDDILLLSALF